MKKEEGFFQEEGGRTLKTGAESFPWEQKLMTCMPKWIQF